MVIAESGHIIAHEQQPIHLFSVTSAIKYPAKFVLDSDKDSICTGQTLTQIAQPLHTSSSIITLDTLHLLKHSYIIISFIITISSITQNEHY